MKTIPSKRQPSTAAKKQQPIDSARKSSRKEMRSYSKLSIKNTMNQIYHKVVVSKPQEANRTEEPASKKDRFVNIFRESNSLASVAKGSPEQSQV